MKKWCIFRYTDGKTYRLRRGFPKKADAQEYAEKLARKYPYSAFRIGRGCAV